LNFYFSQVNHIFKEWEYTGWPKKSATTKWSKNRVKSY